LCTLDRPVTWQGVSTPPFLDLPASARPVRLTTNRVELAALVAEPEGEATSTALLVPGFTGSKEDFIGVLDPLARSGWRVVAIDQRGQFESSATEDPSHYDLEELGADLLAVVSALGDGPVHLVGHSFGGLVARAAAIAEPSALRSLTLLCSGPGPIPPPGRDRLRLLLQALPNVDLATIWEVSRRLDEEAGAPPPPAATLEFLRRRFLATSPTALTRQAEQLLETPDRTEELATVMARAGLPVLVAHGETDDAWTPREQADVAARLGAAYEVLVAAGHSPAAERPEATADLLHRFWRAPGAREAGAVAAR
jgi:pimeloyl-ACP methyl ester carboxylesterase